MSSQYVAGAHNGPARDSSSAILRCSAATGAIEPSSFGRRSSRHVECDMQLSAGGSPRAKGYRLRVAV